MHGRLNPKSGLLDVFQRIYSVEGVFGERLIGSFFFHPDHDHWHIEDIAMYELWSVDSENVLDQRILRSRKASYCLRDAAHLAEDPHPEGWPDFSVYTDCDNVIQGISPGWMDIYSWDMLGQEIEITGLPDGTYFLITTVNPDWILFESDLNNNVGTTRFRLTGDGIVILETSSGLFLTSPAAPPVRKT